MRVAGLAAVLAPSLRQRQFGSLPAAQQREIYWEYVHQLQPEQQMAVHQLPPGQLMELLQTYIDSRLPAEPVFFQPQPGQPGC